MDKVEVPDDQVVRMDAIAPGLSGLKITFVNVFGVTHDDGSWTLIDAAIPFSAGRMESWANKTFGRAPNAIVLTHGHFDHVSAARGPFRGMGRSGVRASVGVSVSDRSQEDPRPNWAAGGGAMPLMSPTLPRGPIDSAAGCWLCRMKARAVRSPSFPDGPCSHPATHRAMSASSASAIARCWSAMPSAPPRRKVFSKPISPGPRAAWPARLFHLGLGSRQGLGPQTRRARSHNGRHRPRQAAHRPRCRRLTAQTRGRLRTHRRAGKMSKPERSLW